MARQDERMSCLFLVNMTQVLEPVVGSLTFPPSLDHIAESSPWSTTLISTLLRPLLILLLMLTFGPCIINRLIAFVKERINTVQLFVLRQQYQTVSQDREEDSSI